MTILEILYLIVTFSHFEIGIYYANYYCIYLLSFLTLKWVFIIPIIIIVIIRNEQHEIV